MADLIKTLLLINPAARVGRSPNQKKQQRWKNQQERVLEILGKENTEVFFTQAEDHGRKRVAAALQDGVKRVVVIGGDGTISEAVQGFFANHLPVAPDAQLGVLPSGRGDDFLKTLLHHRFLSSQTAWAEALNVLEAGKSAQVDVGKITWIFEDSEGGGSRASSPDLDTVTTGPKEYFINITSFAFPGLVVQRVQSKTGYLSNSMIGKSAWTYALQAVLANGSYQALPLQVKVDGEILFEGPVHSGYILNGQFNAGGICWDRTAKLEDGLFNILVIDGKSKWQSFKNSTRLALSHGEIPESEGNGKSGIFWKKGKVVEVRLKAGMKKPHPLFEVDGDLSEPSDAIGARFEVLPQVFRVILS